LADVRSLIPILLIASSALAQWQMQDSHSKESLRSVSIVNRNTAWSSGTHGTYLITSNGGKAWTPHQVPGAEQLDFRGVKAFGAEAFLLAAGPGDKSRIYRTSDSSRHWDLQLTNPDPKGFFDCMAFSDPAHGAIVGDPVNGKFQVLLTADGGKNWRYSDPKKMPPAFDGEGAFAASNSCIAIRNHNLWFVTGGPVARVFRSRDEGKTWTVVETPIVHGSASQGIFSIAFSDVLHGVIAGGDHAHPDQGGSNLAVTEDGGKTWKLAHVTPQKFFSAVAYMSTGPGLILVGSGVTACAPGALQAWKCILADGFNAVESRQGVTYAVGASGKIGKFVPP
jgi:photosystem II stability/assembly factor-like uncharacterized protein